MFERDAGPGLIVALNNDVWNPNWYTVTVQTNWPPGWEINDYTGNNQQRCWVDDNSQITFGIPPAGNGMGFGLWAPAGIGGPPRQPARATTQYFEGADSLIIPPLTASLALIGRVWCAANTTISATLYDGGGSTPTFPCELQVSNADGILGQATTRACTVHTKASGWHGLYAASSAASSSGIAFRLKVTYTATTTLAPNQ